MSAQGPLVIAHRGESRHAPENTLAAFRAAVDSGADGIELDVQLTKDGVPVVFHDLTLKRIASRKDRIIDLNAIELAEVDVGRWFNAKWRDRAKPEFAGEAIPTLENVLDLLQNYAGRIYVELKCEERDVRRLVGVVSETLRRSPMLPQMIIKSFQPRAIIEIKALLPRARTAALFAPKLSEYIKGKRHLIALARELGADDISLHRSLASRKLCSLAAAAEIPVTVWTVDDPRWVPRCRQRGIGALITNDPAAILAARGELKNS